MLHGRTVTLRPVTDGDVPALAAIRATPEVRRWWRGGDDLAGSVRADLADDALTVYAIEHSGRLVGAIQWYAETEPDYRHASLDVFLDPAVRGTGLGGTRSAPWYGTWSTSTATTGSPSTRRRRTRRPSARTRRWGSVRWASCAATSVARTGAGTTRC